MRVRSNVNRGALRIDCEYEMSINQAKALIEEGAVSPCIPTPTPQPLPHTNLPDTPKTDEARKYPWQRKHDKGMK